MKETRMAQGFKSLKINFGCLIVIILFAVVVMFIAVANAQEHHAHEGVVGKFYQSWTMPDSPKTSCCHDQDCAAAPSRFINNRWQAQTPTGLWVTIPPNKVEQNRDSPDGRSHLCGRQTMIGEFSVFCFLPAGGT